MKFEIVKDKAGELRFRILANNGSILANSGVSYRSKEELMLAIDGIKMWAAEAPVFEQIESETKDWKAQAIEQLRRSKGVMQ